MGESQCTLTLMDVAESLQAKYAYISGGKAQNGCPIITFPDIPHLQEISEEQYGNVVNYLTSIPTLQEVDLGFVVIVDRRQCGWGMVKTLLNRISAFFPGLVQQVLVLRPTGLLQRTFTGMGFKFVQNDFKFKVVMCGTLEELYEHIDKSQLTEDLGGSLTYSHDEWIQHRAAIEKFSSNTTHIGQRLRSLCENLQETEFPNNVAATEALIQKHEEDRKQVKEDLHSTINHGDILLTCFRTIRTPSGEEQILPTPDLPTCKVIHITAVERLLVQLEETERNFDEFWYHHERRLQQCLELRKFEEDFKQLHFPLDRHIGMLKEMSDMGDSITRVENLLQELADFEQGSQNDIERAEDLRRHGDQLIEDDHYAVDCIRPKCIELQRMCQQYRELVRRRHDLLLRSKELQDRIDKATVWCDNGTKLLNSYPLDQCNTLEVAQDALRHLDDFVATTDDLRLTNPKEFHQLFDNMITPETRATVQNTLKNVEEIKAACDKRRTNLIYVAKKLTRPAEPAHPVPIPLSNRPFPISSALLSPESPTHMDGGERKRRKGFRRSGNFDKNSRQLEVIHVDSGISDNGSLLFDSESSDDHGNSISNRDDLDVMQAKRGHVMKELVDTERIYVLEINSIIEGYFKMMDSPDLAHLLPATLVSQKDVLFGNLVEIHDFHKHVFLKDLENCRSTPSLVGKCFVQRSEELQMYSTYCQNKLRSEALLREVGDNHPFFQECQRRLNQKLPLEAYLLQPVQRVTKYQLLLKEMLKYTGDNEEERFDLEAALDTMLSVLKYVNDSMYQVAISGFPGVLNDLGKLLMQGPFHVWTAHKKDKIKDLRFKPMQRHVFLYAKRILFCKKKDAVTGEKDSYMYKNSIETADMGMTESVKGDKRKFEVWLRGRAEVYIIQAPSMQVKDIWIKEIKKVLMSQFDELKDKVQKCRPAMPLPGDSKYPDSQEIVTNLNQQLRSKGDMRTHFSPYEEDEDSWTSDEEHSNHESSFSESHSMEFMEYVAQDDHTPGSETELRLREGDIVTLIKVGENGWWYVRMLNSGEEGWVPGAYLEPAKRLSSLSTLSMSSNDSGGGMSRSANRSSMNSGMSLGSIPSETLV